MAKTSIKTPADFIAPLNVNGLSGRMLAASSTTKKNRSILVVYDQHSTLERWWPLVEELRRYGQVTMPDLPGFGGMRGFYRLNRKPNIDALAGYLAAFIKLRFKRKPVTIVAIGLGFAVATRMLQQYPDLPKKVGMMVAIDGFAHHKDLKCSELQRFKHLAVAKLFSSKSSSTFYRNIFLHPLALRARSQGGLPVGCYRQITLPKDSDDLIAAKKANVALWRRNDLRTYLFTCREILHLDNCKSQVPLTLWHVTSKSNEDYDRFRADQHLKVIFNKVQVVPSAVDNYAAVGIVPMKKSIRLLPPKIKSQLSKS